MMMMVVGGGNDDDLCVNLYKSVMTACLLFY